MDAEPTAAAGDGGAVSEGVLPLMVNGSGFMVKGYFNVNANLDLNGERE